MDFPNEFSALICFKLAHHIGRQVVLLGFQHFQSLTDERSFIQNAYEHDGRLVAKSLLDVGAKNTCVLSENCQAADSIHKSSFDACWLRGSVRNSIKRIEKPIFEFIELYKGKAAKTYSWSASFERLFFARK